jgi:hypothetical protein
VRQKCQREWEVGQVPRSQALATLTRLASWETVMNSKCRRTCGCPLPSNSSMTRDSLPSPGFPRFEFPCFVGTTECSDVPPLVRPRFGVPWLGRTFPRACVRSRGPDAGPGPGALGLAAPCQRLREGNDGTSQVPGESCCPLYGTGLVTRRIPAKGFRAASDISSSFPKLA